jgi:histidine transport system permease protein
VVAAFIYLMITSVSNLVLRHLERRYSAGTREAVR